MKRGIHFGLALAALVSVFACNTSPTGPSRPSAGSPVPPAPPPAPIAVAGEIRLASIAPDAGATVPIWDCDPDRHMRLLSGARPAHIIGLCTDKLIATFEVLVDHDVPDTRLTVEFRNGNTRCAVAYMERKPLTAGVRTTFTSTQLVLSDDPDIPVACPLPATTTQIFVELWPYAPYTFSRRITGEFDRTYSFAMP